MFEVDRTKGHPTEAEIDETLEESSRRVTLRDGPWTGIRSAYRSTATGRGGHLITVALYGARSSVQTLSKMFYANVTSPT
jgi:hypothetical protein